MLRDSSQACRNKREGGPIYRGASRMVMLRDTWQSYLPRGTSNKSSSIRVPVQFFSRFSRKLFGTLWYPKWVICGTFGNLEKSTFQRYQVCANRSLDGKVMALRSRGIRAVFLHSSSEDSDQTRDVTRESRVVYCC